MATITPEQIKDAFGQMPVRQRRQLLKELAKELVDDETTPEQDRAMAAIAQKAEKEPHHDLSEALEALEYARKRAK